MSLTTALNIAQSSLRSLTRQTSIVSSNVANAQNPDYTRRSATIESTNGGVRFVEVRRHTSDGLFASAMRALSDGEAQSTLADRISTLRADLLGADDSLSLQSFLSEFQNALQTFAGQPSNNQFASVVVARAGDLATRLNEVSGSIQSFRTDIDAQISDSVDTLNGLLAEFGEVNTDIVNGTRLGRDVSDLLDRRDAMLKEISTLVPLQTLGRADNDIVLMTRGGTTLFETMPRTVSFDRTMTFAPGVTGNPIRIDGVPLSGGIGANTDASGQLAALVQLRDTVAPTLQAQADEFARGLISAFAEQDQSGGGLPALAGLFSHAGGPALPPAGTVTTGLAGSIVINAAFDPAQGGDPTQLRDGGANGAAYLENAAASPAFADRLIQFGQNLLEPLSFDAVTGIDGNRSVESFGSEMTGWLDGFRSRALQSSETKAALAARLQETLANETGVNIDEEMSKLLDLEHSYEASARVISAVDDMLSTLLASVR
ncbi:MAG: flagellar hook-associated protein FlgK [Brucellaceae bacterium]|nr:flagellar hook-associated protein FlgK [Brucellaceae bacterium]